MRAYNWLRLYYIYSATRVHNWLRLYYINSAPRRITDLVYTISIAPHGQIMPNWMISSSVDHLALILVADITSRYRLSTEYISSSRLCLHVLHSLYLLLLKQSVLKSKGKKFRNKLCLLDAQLFSPDSFVLWIKYLATVTLYSRVVHCSKNGPLLYYIERLL